MKKYFIHFTAIVTMVSMLLTTSCQQVEKPFSNGKESTVSFTVSTPEMATRAVGDGTTATKLYYGVYNENGELIEAISKIDKDNPQEIKGTTNVELVLVNSDTYSIVFWAENSESVSTIDWVNKTMTFNPTEANTEEYDAFYHYEGPFTVNGALNKEIKLTRPFAQLNIGTKDKTAAANAGLVVTSTQVTISEAADQMDLFTSSVVESTESQVYGYTEIADLEKETFPVSGNEYLSMNYVLTSKDKQLVDVVFNYKNAAGKEYTRKYDRIPVQRNYRTNIYGALLTDEVDYEVEIVPVFKDPAHTEFVFDGKNYTEVTTAEAANNAFKEGDMSVYLKSITANVDIELPVSTQDVFLALGSTDKKVTVKYRDANGDKPAKVYVTLPEGDVEEMDLQLSSSTVYLSVNGKVETLTSSTAQNTLYIVNGSVKNLAVAQGNVVIENNAGVDNIVQTADNNGTTKVIVAEGADMPNNINNDSNIIIDGDVVVVRGSKGYGSLDAALSDSENTSTTITLCKNLVLTSPLTIHNELTINLREYDLTYTSDVMGESMIDNKGKLTFEGNGRVIYTYTGVNDPAYGKGNYLINNSADLTINGGSFKFVIPGYQGKKFSHALYVVNTAGNFTMNGGELVNEYNNAVRFWATSLNDVKTLTVNNGHIKGLRAIWLQLPSSNAAQAPKATININGGKLEGTAIDGTADSGNILAFYSYSYGQSFENVNINITGGEIVGDVALTGGKNKQIIEKLNISGGTFDGLYGDVYSYGDDKLASQSITITGGKFSSIDPMKYMDQENEIITLASNVDVSTNENDTYMLFDGKGTLDLNNKTIKHTSARTGKNQVMIDVRGKLTVKDGTITTQHIGDNMAWSNCTEIFYVGFNGTLNLIDATLENLGGSDMAYCVDLVNASEPDGITVNIENSVLKSTYIPFRVFNNGNGINKVTINNSTLEGTSRAVWIHIYTVEDNKGIVKDSTLELDIYDNGNTFIANDPNRIIEFGFTNPINFDAYGNPLIKNAAQLKWFADQVNVSKNSFAGKTVKLIANINLENQDWKPIGQTGKTTFLGVFDGQEHTISNLNIDSEAETGAYYSSGLFGWIESHTQGQGHIKNVKISNATVKGHHNCGALVGYITQETALVENCHVENATITCTRANDDADGDKAGAMIGNATVATPVKNCTVSKSTVSAGRDAGQVIGAGKEANVTGCSASEVTVTANGTGTGANVRNEVIGRLL